MIVSYGRTRRWLLLMSILATAAACRDTVAPRNMRVPIQLAKDISDGAHNGGNSDVFFLPPMVGNPVGTSGYGDPFQPGLPVEIKIVCKQPYGTSACTGTDFLPGAVTMSPNDQWYSVSWDTKSPGVDPLDVFEIQVLVGSKMIAFADVIITSGNPKNAQTQGDITLNDGRTLPIKVRIEQGWACADRVNRTCTSQVVGNTPIGSPTYVLAPQHTGAAAFEGNWIPFCTSTPTPGCVPAGTQVVVTAEDQTALLNLPPAPGVPAPTCSLITNGVPITHMLTSDTHCVKFTTDPVFKFAAPVKVAVCVESDDPTEQLLKYDVNETPRFLKNIQFNVNGIPFAALCEPGQQIGAHYANPAINFATNALHGLGQALKSLVVPKSAYALHNGVGGLIDDGGGFSYVAPGRPETLSKLSGDLQTGVVFNSLPNPIKVQISTVHQPVDVEGGFPNPLANVGVVCSIDNGSGNFPGGGDTQGPTIANVTTDVNGVATCPAWILGAVGTNTMHVSVPGIDDGIIAVEEFASELGGVTPQPVTLVGTVTFTAQGINASAVTLQAPANGSIFNFFPRTTNLTWSTASGATGYQVDLAYCNGFDWNVGSTTPDYGCTNWISYPAVNTTGPSYTFDFVGAQPGRWRVRAAFPGGVFGPYSDYSYFLYLQ